ncbi:MAG: hypothetical protein B6244_09200 [Candidatus Cloacimonetes bacterium 4572_55]|nr:MAG: hypothetical protein B6244_09200 [Candidatus Cloacimonetes bacterium 4572_55]
MYKKSLFFLLSFIIPIFIIPISLEAQHFPFNVYTTQDGLPVSQVWTVHQASNGYIWIGSYGGGVTRFDGYNFETFMRRHGLAHNMVHTIYEDSIGRLWFGTLGGGICYWDGREFVTFNKDNGLPGNTALSICEDREGTIWIGLSEKGLACWDGKTFRSVTPDPDQNISIFSVQSLCLDKDQRLWVGANSGLYLYDDGRFYDYTDSLSYPPDVPRKTVIHLYQDRSGKMWVCTWSHGIHIFDGNDFYQLPYLDTLKGNVVWQILEDSSGSFWFASDDLYYYDGENLNRFSHKQGLAEGVVRGLIEDHEGNIWIASYGGGLTKKGRMLFVSYTEEDNLVDKNITAICEFDSGAYLFGTANSGIIGMLQNDASQLNPHISCIKKDDTGDIWIGTRGGGIGVIKENKLTDILNSEHGFLSNYVNEIFIDWDGMIWVATEEGLYYVDPTTYEAERITDLMSINDVIRDDEGRLWVGCSRGLAIVDEEDKTYQLFSTADGLSDDYITCLEIDKDGNLWIGSSYGVSFYHNGTFSVPESLIDPLYGKISFIQFSWDGNIWFGASHGVYRYQPDKEKLIHYTTHSGLAGDETNPGAVYIDSEGYPWFGTTQGVSCFNIESDKKNALPSPPVYIENFQVFGRDYFHPRASSQSLAIRSRIKSRSATQDAVFFEKAGANITKDHHQILDHTQHYCAFEFIGLCYSNPNSIFYQYRLKGLNDEWITTRHQYVAYSNLAPNSYTFQVKAANSDDVWSEEPAQFSFTIKAPWWKMIWFRFVLISLVVVGAPTFYLYQIQRIKTKNAMELEREKDNLEKRRLKEELDRARVVQTSMLPTEDPVVPGFDIAGMSRPATEVGGDYYDFVWQKSGRSPQSRDQAPPLHIIIGDVAGHGMSSGLIVSMCKSCVYMYNQVKKKPEPALALQELNKMIIRTSKERLLMTCVYARLDINNRDILFSSAGHPFPFHYKAAEDRIDEIELCSFPLGVPEAEFQQKKIHLNCNDVILFYTDGIVEHFNPKREMFGFDRLERGLKENAHLSAATLRDRLLEAVEEFSEGNPQDDDITLVVIKVKREK